MITTQELCLGDATDERVKSVCPNFIPFDDLTASTNTIMAYFNRSFNLIDWFEHIKISPINVLSTRKKNNIDKKSVKGKYGSIVGVHLMGEYRGIDLKKQKKHWCEVTCRITDQKGQKEVKSNTIVERKYHIVGDKYGKRYYCENCCQEYTIKQLKKIAHFLNQLTISIFVGKVGKEVLLNIMVFCGELSCMKIAGCKEGDDAAEAVMLLWENFGLKNFSKRVIDEPTKVVFKSVMTNVDFKLDFPIDRVSLNELMNSEIYNKIVYCSYYESTSRANVNIKMYKSKPKGYYFDCLVFPDDITQKPLWEKLPNNPYKQVKNKSKETKYTTFIVFSSSKIILSGKYKQNMKECYNLFVEVAYKNRLEIEENIQNNNHIMSDIIEYMKEGKQIDATNFDEFLKSRTKTA